MTMLGERTRARLEALTCGPQQDPHPHSHPPPHSLPPGPCLGAIAASLVYQYLFEYVPTDEALAVEEEEVKKDGEVSLAEAVGLGSPSFSSKTPVKAAASPLPVEAVSNEPSGLWAK